ncbi:hypothetical protein MMC34_000638 [Xylographa carneopallida]|nr:hypothetical protein [Xylographa carneopallida]
MDPSLNTTLADELVAINAIHPSALTQLSTSPDICALRLPVHPSISIRLSFPPSYPDSPPCVLGPESSGGEGTRKGEGRRIATLVEETLVRVYQPGEPCVFALLDDIAEAVAQEGGESDGTVGTEGELVEFNPSGLLIAATVGSTAVGRSLKEQEGRGQEMYHALVRTHHITSRKKVAKLKQAADALGVYVLLRSGGSPGLMYVEGREEGVKEWVSVVQSYEEKFAKEANDELQRLRYKDYQLAARPAGIEGSDHEGADSVGAGLHEVAAVKDFGLKMDEKGILGWWRRAMGYTS